MDNAKHIEIALRAGMIAKSALDMITSRDPFTLELMARKCRDEVDEMLKTIIKLDCKKPIPKGE
jgi:hypothetical protein